MMRKRWVWAALAVAVAGVIGTSTAKASDVVRLGLNVGAPTVTLDLRPDNDADTQETTFWRGGFGGYRNSFYGGFGGYRNNFYGGYGGFRNSFYGGYGGFRNNFYGGYGGYNSFYRPSFYGGYGGYGGYNSFYQPSFYGGYGYGYNSFYQPSYSYYSPYYCPISLNVNPCPSASLPGGSYRTIVPSTTPLPPMDPAPSSKPSEPVPQGKPSDGTFPYDGGPSNPVPMPQDGSTPQNAPNKGFVPGEGRLVSLPIGTARAKYSYPAYGDNK